MHAEKQLPVGNLRSMFESGRVAGPVDPKAKKKEKEAGKAAKGAGPSRATSFKGGEGPPPVKKKLW